MEPLRGLEALWHFEWRCRLSGRLLGGKHFGNRSEGVNARSGQYSKQSTAQTKNKRKWRFWFSSLDPQAKHAQDAARMDFRSADRWGSGVWWARIWENHISFCFAYFLRNICSSKLLTFSILGVARGMGRCWSWGWPNLLVSEKQLCEPQSARASKTQMSE